jgi:hypothetical protein
MCLEFVFIPIQKCVDPLLCVRFNSIMCEREASIGRLENKIHKDIFLGFKEFLL